jgi:2-C-methyl-D-erythritol 4-phosphate cytidylyltransferase
MLIQDAILLGGGVGTRFAETIGRDQTLPKQFHLLDDKPVFIHALNSLLGLGIFRQIIVTAPKYHLRLAEEQIEKYALNIARIPIRVIAGGNRRQDSSRLALESLEEIGPAPTRVLIHDACRPFLSETLLSSIQNCLRDRAYGAWVPVIPVVDTLKRVQNHQVVETVDRSIIQRVQTPQIFEYTVIRSLVERVKSFPELNFTDDASLCEYYGIPVGVFEGDVKNIKLTYDFEFETLRQIVAENKKTIPCEPESATTFIV